MQRVWLVAVIASGVACDEPLVLSTKQKAAMPAGPSKPGPQPQPQSAQPHAPRDPDSQPPAEAVVQPAPAAVRKPAAIESFEISEGIGHLPMKIAVAGGTLAWVDAAGSLWTMPSKGGEARELSNQHMAGRPMFGNMVVLGNEIVAAKDTELVRVTLPNGPLTSIKSLGDDDWIVDMVSDGTAVYGTRMESDAIFRVALDGTQTTVASLKRAGLAVRGDTLYAVSYSRGTVIAVKTTGGKPRTIARGLPHPTGFAVDDKAAYAWCEGDSALRRIDLKTGKTTFLEKQGLANTDELVADGDWIYATTWADSGKLVRVAKDGSGTQVLADNLAAPYSIAVDDEAVYVSVRDDHKIMRFEKTAIRPL